MDAFQSNLAAGAVSNFIFVCIFAIGAWLKQRLNDSECHMNCGWLSCDSSLKELHTIKDKLEKTQGTQHKMLQDIVIMLRENEPSIRKDGQPGAIV